MSRRFCLTLDLKNDPKLIAQYKRYHEKVWPEIIESIKDSGIEDMEIYLLGTRMFMIMEVNDSFHLREESQGRQAQSQGAGVGRTHVEVPAGAAAGEKGREVAADGEALQVGRVKRHPH